MALLCGDQIVVYLRDDKPGIPFPGMWDLPGGGREGAESPIECGLREVEEEFGLSLNPDNVLAIICYESGTGGLDTYFAAMALSDADISKIVFGDEGQRWEMMPVRTFIDHEKAVPHLRNRLQNFVISRSTDAGI